MRVNLENYRDTMRCDTPRQDRRSSHKRDAAEMLLNGPGRKLGQGLDKLWSSAKKMIHLHERTGTWDFDQTIQDDSGPNQKQQSDEDNIVHETNVIDEIVMNAQSLNASQDIERQEIEREPEVEGSLVDKSNNFDKSRASSINATVEVEEKTHEAIENKVDNVSESNLENIEEEPKKNNTKWASSLVT